MRIEVGYGLEPRLTDAECFRIIEELKPHFRSGDYATGLTNAVTAMIAATEGEYTGTGKTLSEQSEDSGSSLLGTLFVIFIVFLVFRTFVKNLHKIQRNVVYGPNGSQTLPDVATSSWWNTSSSSSWGDSGGSSFSGGGGSSGGGGASGDW